LTPRDTPESGILAVSLLTLLAFTIAGYHPFVEDGGVYAAGIEKLLNPTLFPTWTPFVTEHLRFSLFAPLIAHIAQVVHLPLEWTLLLLYLFSIWLTVYAAWLLTTRITAKPSARVAAVTLLACWLTLPIAGTSLMLMDPYLTARSFTTPLTLFALAWALDALAGRRVAWCLCAVSLLAAALLHPLMAGYGFAAVLMLCCCRLPLRRDARRAQLALLFAALAVAFTIQSLAPAETPLYVQIALSRYYWFPFTWHWYEQLGLIAPILILHWRRGPHRDRNDPSPRSVTRDVAQSGMQLGLIAILVAVLFAHESYATHLVARLQPLRSFQIVYELMILLLGVWLGEHLLKQHRWRWAMLLLVLAPPMFYAQRATFPNSAHIEWPGASAHNPWQQAFVWIRDNSLTDALFALDAHYITEGKHEDAQCFRAIAQRSALPDYSKDGGEASITPALADAWARGESAQTGLETEPDATRLTRLRPFGVTWVVLAASSETSWPCPYRNQTVKVCRLP
jgi:hypothetical protein